MVPICLDFDLSLPFCEGYTKAQLEYEIRWNTGMFFVSQKERFFDYYRQKEKKSHQIFMDTIEDFWSLLKSSWRSPSSSLSLAKTYRKKVESFLWFTALLLSLYKGWNNGSHISRSYDSVDSLKCHLSRGNPRFRCSIKLYSVEWQWISSSFNWNCFKGH